jgi:hypothetical protein
MCRERFELQDVIDMKRHLRHLDPRLRDKFKTSFDKKRKGMIRHANEDRVGEGLHFPFPEDIQSYIDERNAAWKENFREVPTEMLNESLMAANVVAGKSEARETKSGALTKGNKN